MAEFDLKIVTPQGEVFSGKARAINVPGAVGRLSVWANHANLVTALDKGKATVTTAEGRRDGYVEGGMMSVLNNNVTVLTPSFTWNEEK